MIMVNNISFSLKLSIQPLQIKVAYSNSSPHTKLGGVRVSCSLEIWSFFAVDFGDFEL